MIKAPMVMLVILFLAYLESPKICSLRDMILLVLWKYYFSSTRYSCPVLWLCWYDHTFPNLLLGGSPQSWLLWYGSSDFLHVVFTLMYNDVPWVLLPCDFCFTVFLVYLIISNFSQLPLNVFCTITVMSYQIQLGREISQYQTNHHCFRKVSLGL